ncbi:unnamed protein product [Acanthoscelides obtectus]|uniref:DDE-1 domain-containing protein n=1 Tax=Acanthoscelides obtectus TaxID=200917 RepID=A0A9P0K7D8_ACAOB|nr:unnamed protein product [Acanthoscelides obtectus]CAK1652030.1 hypothetical protein AOBTE_LOCUS17628 [Acanthoscelides obtectus]
MLLILDGHSTHTKNIQAIRLAREYGIIMLSLPAHTTYRLQPLDKSFFKSLKHHFNDASEAWMRTHPGSVIKQTDIAELLGVAYLRAASMAPVLHGFEACGLWPPDRHKIREDDYVAMDISLEEDDRSTLEGSNDETGTLTHKIIIKHERSSENRIMEATIGQMYPFDDPQPSTSSGGITESKFLNLKDIEDSSVSVFVDKKMSLKEIVSSAHKIGKLAPRAFKPEADIPWEMLMCCRM